MILEFDEYWISKVDQKLFEYDSGKYIATFGFVEGDHDAVYIRIYELRVWNSVSDWIFQGGHWIEKDWTEIFVDGYSNRYDRADRIIGGTIFQVEVVHIGKQWKTTKTKFGGNLGDIPNEKYAKFFATFNEIDVLEVSQWKVSHIIGYVCKKYRQYYGIESEIEV